MNFQKKFELGQTGINIGLSTGLPRLDRVIGGVQKAKYYGIASAPKVGKSTFINQCFLYEPWLEARDKKLNVRWIYFTFEMSRVFLEFCTVVYFIHRNYQLTQIKLEEGQTFGGKNVIDFSTDYLMGHIVDDQGNLIKVKDSVKEVMFQIHQEYVEPMFGKYNSKGEIEKYGRVWVVESPSNPTGLFKDIVAYAVSRGKLTRVFADGQDPKKDIGRLIAYSPEDPEEQVILIVDHIRKIKSEQGKREKEIMDLWSNYCITIRDILSYTVVNIVHLNRSLSEIDRLKQFGDMLYPDSDMVKGSGNIAEDCDHMLTLFNPNDNRYNLTKHFSHTIRDKHGDELYPNLRTVHLVESRHAPFPQHWAMKMEGNVKTFIDQSPFKQS